MTLFYILFVPFIFFCLFIMFVLARHDFVILRRNITLFQFFDRIFISIIIGGILGRVMYIFSSGEFYLFHVLAFFHLFRNPGFSIFGFYIGLVLSIIVFFRKSKILLRTLDIIALSFFPLVILNILISTYPLNNIFVSVGVGFLLSFVLWTGFRLNKNYSLTDGSIACLLFSVISINTVITNFSNLHSIVDFFTFSGWIGLLTLICSIILFTLIQSRKKNR